MDYSVLKRNELSRHEKTWRNFKCTLLSERSQSGKGTYHIISTIWQPEKGKTMETIKESVVSGASGGGREEEGGHRGFLRLWNYSVYYNGGVRHLSEFIECTDTKSEPNVNYGLWILMTYQCRFTHCNKYITLVWNVYSRGGSVCIGAGGIWETSVPSTQFCCKPKSALKI